MENWILIADKLPPLNTDILLSNGKEVTCGQMYEVVQTFKGGKTFFSFGVCVSAQNMTSEFYLDGGDPVKWMPMPDPN